jgi:formiminoglutamase
MIWYFIEGFANKKNEIIPVASDCTKFTVPSSIGKKQIAFWKSNKTERWWMALPSLEEGGKATLVPCSYEDYKLASQGDLSDRLMKAVNRFYK